MERLNQFKNSLKVDTEKTKRIDEKISANIAKLLADMSRNTTDKEERIQILNRMININKIFENFDEEINVLKSEKERKQQNVKNVNNENEKE